MRGLAIAAMGVVAIVGAGAARAEPMRVVVRDGGGGRDGDALDAIAVRRLRGQIADLDIDATYTPGAIEPGLDAQVAAAARLADRDGARAVVWFVIAKDGGLEVAVATPGDRRLFVRSIPADDPSAVAEAGAIAARGALKAIALGGTIGVELPPPPPATRTQLEASVGWQLALDGGADDGAHAIAQRTAIARGAWAASLELSLGPPLQRAGDAVVELSRSGAALGIERRVGGGVAIGASAGVLLYHRATVSSPSGLAATPSAFTAAFVAGPALRWRWRPRGVAIGIEATAALDVVAGAPELVVEDASGVRSLGAIRVVQPRFGVSIIAGLP